MITSATESFIYEEKDIYISNKKLLDSFNRFKYFNKIK